MNAKNQIVEFSGEYAFLSNFYPCFVTYDDLTYRCAEAAYQAQKCETKVARLGFQWVDAEAAKRRGKKVALPLNWDNRRADIMREIVHAKFIQNPELAAKLIATGNAELIEGNNWHDNFFGVCVCPACTKIGRGENKLGRILMAERASLNGVSYDEP